MLKIITSSFVSAKKTLKATSNFNFLMFKAKLAFLQLTKAFTKALILHHFNLKCYI